MTKNEQEALLKSQSMVVDEFWPEGVEVPGQKLVSVVNTTENGKKKPKDIVATVAGQDWQTLSRSLGLELYERQPEESDNEWLAWITYREYYPGKLPTMSELAQKLHMTVATLLKYSQKWNWKVRMIHWARATDADSMSQRRDAIKEMNRQQLEITQTMMSKLVEAMDYLDPATMKPSEITNMMKFATGLQKEINTYVDEKIDQPALDANTVKQAQLTKKEELSDVAQILASVGLLGNKQGTKTTVIIQEDKDGTES